MHDQRERHHSERKRNPPTCGLANHRHLDHPLKVNNEPAGSSRPDALIDTMPARQFSEAEPHNASPVPRTQRRMSWLPPIAVSFLSHVGSGMLAAGLGASLADDLGCSTAFAYSGTDGIPLGEYQSLVELIRSTPADKLQPLLASQILNGKTDLKKTDCCRRTRQRRHLWWLRLCRLSHGHGHDPRARNEQTGRLSASTAARSQSSLSQRSTDPERRRGLDSSSPGTSRGRTSRRRRSRPAGARCRPPGRRRTGRENSGRCRRFSARDVQRAAASGAGPTSTSTATFLHTVPTD